jgi:signal transduction histidine kinase
MKYIKLNLIIEDNGVGISSANIKKLFTNYSRLDEHRKLNATGTGLGLSICKNIIEQMGGSVHVESEVNKGTKFEITISFKAI